MDFEYFFLCLSFWLSVCLGIGTIIVYLNKPPFHPKALKDPFLCQMLEHDIHILPASYFRQHIIDKKKYREIGVKFTCLTCNYFHSMEWHGKKRFVKNYQPHMDEEDDA